MKIVFIALCVALAVAIVCALVKKKRKSAIGKIYKTTDGFLVNNVRNKKNRFVVAVEQREKDGAIAVSKIYGEDEKKTGDFYIDNLKLTPEKHASLKKNSLVGRRVIWGVKIDKNKYKPIFKSDMSTTKDKLTKREFKLVNRQAGGKTPKNRITYRNTRRQWKSGFKKKKR